jgi:hypothetical protein
MNEKPSLPNRGSFSSGAIGLAFAILFCIEIAVAPPRVYSVLLGAALGFTGLAISLRGIAKRSGRAAGVCGILVFLVGCVMTYSVGLDIMAFHRAHPE